MIKNMFKCVYRKKDGSKDFVILDKKNRERAFAQAKDLGLTVIEMLSCGKPVKVREQAKTRIRQRMKIPRLIWMNAS